MSIRLAALTAMLLVASSASAQEVPAAPAAPAMPASPTALVAPTAPVAPETASPPETSKPVCPDGCESAAIDIREDRLIITGDAISRLTREFQEAVEREAASSPGNETEILFDEDDLAALVGDDARAALGTANLYGWGIARLVLVLGLLPLLMLVAAFAPKKTRAAVDSLEARPGGALASGAVVVAFGTIACTVLAITVIGLPLAFLGYVALSLLGCVGLLIAGGRLGDLMWRSEGTSPWLKACAGLFAIALVVAIPYVGGVVLVCASFVGAGAIVIAWSSRPAESHPLDSAISVS